MTTMNSITESEYKYRTRLVSRQWLKLDGDRDVRGLVRNQIDEDLGKFSSLGHDCMITEFPGSNEFSGAWSLHSLGKKAEEYNDHRKSIRIQL